MAYTDQQVGRLLEGLEDLGVGENTLVILTSDHGEGLGEHGELTHGFFVYQSTVHVPLLMRLPGRIPAGNRISAPVNLVDVLPTVLDLTGIRHPEGLEGRSLLQAVTLGQEPAARDQYLETYLPYFQMRWAGSRALRDGRWKFIEAPTPELYDLQNDPEERRNLAAQDPERLAALQFRLEARARWLGSLSGTGAETPAIDDALDLQIRSLGYLAGDDQAGTELHVRSLQRQDTKQKIQLVDEIQKVVPAALDGGDGRALERLVELARQDEGNPRLLTLLGTARKRHGDLSGALLALTRAAELEPDDARAHANVALVLRELGRPEQAREALNRAVAALGGDPQRQRFVASLLLDAGEAAQAESAFRAILEENPADLLALEGLGRALALLGRWKDAQDVLEQVLPQRPEAVESWALAGEAALRAGDPQRAERYLRRALDLDFSRQDVRQMLDELP